MAYFLWTLTVAKKQLSPSSPSHAPLCLLWNCFVRFVIVVTLNDMHWSLIGGSVTDSTNTHVTDWTSTRFSQSQGEDHTSVNGRCETQPQSCCYVSPSDGASCMVTSVESLMVLNCSKWFPSMLFSSALGSTKPFSEAGNEGLMLSDTEMGPMVLRGKLLCPVAWDTFARCLEPLLEPRSRDVCVHLATKAAY